MYYTTLNPKTDLARRYLLKAVFSLRRAYLEMLKDTFYPEVVESDQTEEMIFMQDGAPPHWGRNVREWLSENFPERWMGHGSPNMAWPARPPDLTPCDFFLWGFIKSIVYKDRPRDIPHLENMINLAFREVTVEMRMKTMLSYKERLQKVVEAGGSHIEVHRS